MASLIKTLDRIFNLVFTKQLTKIKQIRQKSFIKILTKITPNNSREKR